MCQNPVLCSLAIWLCTGEADGRFRYHDEMVGKSVCITSEKSSQYVNLIAGSLVVEAQKDYSSMRSSFSIDLFPKVFVVRNQYPVLFKRFLDDNIVDYSACLLVHREDFMLLFS
jgi:hypothetical protein